MRIQIRTAIKKRSLQKIIAIVQDVFWVSRAQASCFNVQRVSDITNAKVILIFAHRLFSASRNLSLFIPFFYSPSSIWKQRARKNSKNENTRKTKSAVYVCGWFPARKQPSKPKLKRDVDKKESPENRRKRKGKGKPSFQRIIYIQLPGWPTHRALSIELQAIRSACTRNWVNPYSSFLFSPREKEISERRNSAREFRPRTRRGLYATLPHSCRPEFRLPLGLWTRAALCVTAERIEISLDFWWRERPE